MAFRNELKDRNLYFSRNGNNFPTLLGHLVRFGLVILEFTTLERIHQASIITGVSLTIRSL